MPGPGAGNGTITGEATSVQICFEHIRLQRRLRRDAVLVPLAATVIGEAPRGRVALTVIVGDAVAQRRSRDVDDAAMVRVPILELLADIDDARPALPHGLQHP